MKGEGTPGGTPCRICDELELSDRLDLDLYIGDPSRWPSTIWGLFDPPKGELNPRAQWFGGLRAAQDWFRSKGMDGTFEVRIIRNHYRNHVAIIAASPAELLARGVIAAKDGRALEVPESIDPGAFITYFNKGLGLGNTALDALRNQVEAKLGANEEVPVALLLKLADLGLKLATTTAMIRARGQSLGDLEESDEGFRAGSVGIPSARIGHQRIRTVDGEVRVVTDQGPVDRARYNERARQEGDPPIGGV